MKVLIQLVKNSIAIHVISAWSNRAIFEVPQVWSNIYWVMLLTIYSGITLLTDQVVAGHYLQNPFKSQRTFIPSKQQIFELLLGNQSIGNEKISQRPLRKINNNVKILSYLDIMAIPVMEFQIRWYKISFEEFQFYWGVAICFSFF